jgi:4-amino-4-deoxy-L-arabinose transferase-like glycosyltransferase
MTAVVSRLLRRGMLPESEERRLFPLRWALWTALVALAVRVLVVLWQPIHLFGDDADYQRLAVSLATGHGWGTSQLAPAGGPTAFRPPLFPLFLAGVYKTVGVHLLAARLAEAAVGALGVAGLAVLTAMLFGRRTGLVVGAVACVLPPLVMASTSLMSESLAIPLEVSCFVAIFMYRRTNRIRWALLSGVSFGLLVLTRPEAVVLGLPLSLLALPRPASGWRRPCVERSRVLKALAVLVLGTIVVLAPWELRDRAVMGTWLPLTTQSGFVLAGTYNHTSATVDAGAWRPANFDPADAALIRRHPLADEVELDRRLSSSAFAYLRAHPAYVATVFYENTRRLLDLSSLSATNYGTYSAYGFGGLWGDAEELSTILVLVLGAIGLWSRRARGPTRERTVPLAYWSAPVLLWVTTVVQEAFPRLRALIDPFLVQLCAIGIVAIAARVASSFPSVPFSFALASGSVDARGRGARRYTAVGGNSGRLGAR